MHKPFLSMIALLVLAGCAHSVIPSSQNLPPQFIGYWPPLSTSTMDVGLSIMQDGTMIEMRDQQGSYDPTKIVDKYVYRVLKVENSNNAYLLRYSEKSLEVECVRLNFDIKHVYVTDYLYLSLKYYPLEKSKTIKTEHIQKCQALISKDVFKNMPGYSYSR